MAKNFKFIEGNPNATYVDTATGEPYVNIGIGGSTGAMPIATGNGTAISSTNPLPVKTETDKVNVKTALVDTSSIPIGNVYYPSTEGLVVTQNSCIATFIASCGNGNILALYAEMSNEATGTTSFMRTPLPVIVGEGSSNTVDMPIIGQGQLNELMLRPRSGCSLAFDFNQYIGHRIRFVIVASNTGGAINTAKLTFGGKPIATPTLKYGISNDARFVHSLSTIESDQVNVGTTNNTYDTISQIDVRGCKRVSLYIKYTKGNSTGAKIKVIPNTVRHGMIINAPEFITGTVANYEWLLDDTAATTYRVYDYECEGIPYLTISTLAAVVGATKGLISIQAVRYGIS
jgi:hypothetical protein